MPLTFSLMNVLAVRFFKWKSALHTVCFLLPSHAFQKTSGKNSSKDRSKDITRPRKKEADYSCDLFTCHRMTIKRMWDRSIRLGSPIRLLLDLEV